MSLALPNLAVLVPLAAAVLVGTVPRNEPALARAIGLLGALVELVVLCLLVFGFDPEGPPVQQLVVQPWLPAYGVAWSLGVDGTVLAHLLLVALVFPLALTIGAPPRPGEPPLVVGMLGLQAAWVAVLLARDLITLVACWELAIVALVILLGERGDGRMGVPGRTAAARRYAAHVLPGAAALVGAALILGVGHAHATGGVWSWMLDDLARVTLPGAQQYLGFALVMVAVATVLPLLPLQGWLAPAAVSGPTPPVAVLLGVGMPMAVFLLVRVGLPHFPLAAGEWADPIAALAVVGAIYAALVCWAEREPGRLLAHVALLHLALAVVGAVSGSLSARAGLGPYLLAHGLGLTALTAVFHALRRSRVGNLGELAGWAAVGPRGLSLAILAALILAGLPGSAGFVGELGIVIGVVREGSVELLRPATWGLLAVLALGAGTLGVLRSLWHAGRGSPRPGLERRLRDLDGRETAIGVLALVLAVVVGVAPGWLLARSQAAELDAIQRLHRARCLAIEARNHPRPRSEEEFPALCLDPEARIRQHYGLPAERVGPPPAPVELGDEDPGDEADVEAVEAVEAEAPVASPVGAPADPPALGPGKRAPTGAPADPPALGPGKRAPTGAPAGADENGAGEGAP